MVTVSKHRPDRPVVAQVVRCKFDSQPPRLMLDGWLSSGRQNTSVFHGVTQANSASYSQQDGK